MRTKKVFYKKNSLLENIITLLLGMVNFIHVIIAVPITFLAMFVFLFLPLTLQFKDGWNIRQKLAQLSGEFKGVFQLMRGC